MNFTSEQISISDCGCKEMHALTFPFWESEHRCHLLVFANSLDTSGFGWYRSLHRQRPLLLPGNLEMASLPSGVHTRHFFDSLKTWSTTKVKRLPAYWNIWSPYNKTWSLVLTLAHLQLKNWMGSKTPAEGTGLLRFRMRLTLLPPRSQCSKERPLPISGGWCHFPSTFELAFLCMPCDLLIKLSNFFSHRKVKYLAWTFL